MHFQPFIEASIKINYIDIYDSIRLNSNNWQLRIKNAVYFLSNFKRLTSLKLLETSFSPIGCDYIETFFFFYGSIHLKIEPKANSLLFNLYGGRLLKTLHSALRLSIDMCQSRLKRFISSSLVFRSFWYFLESASDWTTG